MLYCTDMSRTASEMPSSMADTSNCALAARSPSSIWAMTGPSTARVSPTEGSTLSTRSKLSISCNSQVSPTKRTASPPSSASRMNSSTTRPARRRPSMRSFAPGPYVSTVIAGWVASFAGATDVANDLIEGRRRAGLVVDEFILDAELGGLAVRFVGDTCELHEIESLERVDSVDPSVGLTRAVLGPVIAQIDDGLLEARAQLLVSAMELGISLAVLDMSVQYSIDRRQFGKPIGTFQAVKHRCSDMAVRSHASRAQTLFAALHVASRAPD